MISDLQLLKIHLAADDFNDDDAYIVALGDAAEAAVVRRTGRSLRRIVEMGGGQLPADVEHAVRLLVGHWYNQREAVAATSMNEVPQGVEALLAPYRKLV